MSCDGAGLTAPLPLHMSPFSRVLCYPFLLMTSATCLQAPPTHEGCKLLKHQGIAGSYLPDCCCHHSKKDCCCLVPFPLVDAASYVHVPFRRVEVDAALVQQPQGRSRAGKEVAMAGDVVELSESERPLLLGPDPDLMAALGDPEVMARYGRRSRRAMAAVVHQVLLPCPFVHVASSPMPPVMAPPPMPVGRGRRGSATWGCLDAASTFEGVGMDDLLGDLFFLWWVPRYLAPTAVALASPPSW